jgi:hypothetical protein
MAKDKKQNRKQHATGTKLFYVPPEENRAVEDEEDDADGMFLEKEDMRILLNALRSYKPTPEEEQRHDLLLEELEEILVIDYNEEPEDKN